MTDIIINADSKAIDEENNKGILNKNEKQSSMATVLITRLNNL